MLVRITWDKYMKTNNPQPHTSMNNKRSWGLLRSSKAEGAVADRKPIKNALEEYYHLVATGDLIIRLQPSQGLD